MPDRDPPELSASPTVRPPRHGLRRRRPETTWDKNVLKKPSGFGGTLTPLVAHQAYTGILGAAKGRPKDEPRTTAGALLPKRRSFVLSRRTSPK